MLFQNAPGPIREPASPAEAAPGIEPLRHLHAVLTTYCCCNLVETGRTACEILPDHYSEPEQESGYPVPKSIRYRRPDATRDEVLARLLKLNAERAGAEKMTGLVAAASAPTKARKLRGKKSAGAPGQGDLIPPPQKDLFV